MRRTLIVTALAASLSLPALAGPPAPTTTPTPTKTAAPPAAAPAFAGKKEEIRARVAEKIQAFVTGELTSRLNLDAAKGAKLADAVKAHMGRKHERQKALKEAMGKLQQLVDSKAPDAQIKTQLDIVVGASSRDDDVQAFLADTSKFLSVQEQAKLALAMPDVLKDVHKMMREAKREMRGRGAGGFGGGKKDDDEE